MVLQGPVLSTPRSETGEFFKNQLANTCSTERARRLESKVTSSCSPLGAPPTWLEPPTNDRSPSESIVISHEPTVLEPRETVSGLLFDGERIFGGLFLRSALTTSECASSVLSTSG